MSRARTRGPWARASDTHAVQLRRRAGWAGVLLWAGVPSVGQLAGVTSLLDHNIVRRLLDDGLDRWVLVTRRHHEPTGTGPHALLIAQSKRQENRTFEPRALASEARMCVLLHRPKAALDSLVDFAKHRLVRGGVQFAPLVHDSVLAVGGGCNRGAALAALRGRRGPSVAVAREPTVAGSRDHVVGVWRS